jgi:arginine decarboxylase
MKAWTTRDSAELYNVSGWSNGFFGISEDGNVQVTPFGEKGAQIDLKRVVDDLVRRGLSMPLLIRFSDILQRRVEQLSGAFASKIRELGFKVNQQRHVIEELIQFGRPYKLGLEAGSKPELLIAITLLEGQEGMIVCNGYKDQAYIETALLAQKLGPHTLIIADRFQELETIIECSASASTSSRTSACAPSSPAAAPASGQSRAARSSSSASPPARWCRRWSGCARACSTACSCLHFHIGSQITAIRAIKRRAARGDAHLRRAAPPGRQHAVHRRGRRPRGRLRRLADQLPQLQELLARRSTPDIVDAVQQACDEEGRAAPGHRHESGRALVAHHSVLVFDVLGVERGRRAGGPDPRAEDAPSPTWCRSTTYMKDVSRRTSRRATTTPCSSRKRRSPVQPRLPGPRERARAENLFWAICERIRRSCATLDYVPDELEGLEKRAGRHLLLQLLALPVGARPLGGEAAVPDMPIHRLDERPTRRAILADLTCDSDGKVDKFIDLRDVKNVLEVHPVTPASRTTSAMFLVGAYQEILGDLHNLFGDTNAIHISMDEQHGYRIERVIEGDSVTEVLSYVQYDHDTMMAKLRQGIETALTRGSMTFEQSANLVKHFEAGLAGYTYLEDKQLAESLLNSLIPRKSVNSASTTPVQAAAPEDGITMHS